jgi:hypothetical protein
MGPSAAGSRQRSHSQVRVARDSWPHFIVSDSRLPQRVGPVPRIYIPQEQGGPIIPAGTWFSFGRLLRLARLRWRYWNLPPHVVVALQLSVCPVCITSGRTAEKTPPPIVSLLLASFPCVPLCLNVISLLVAKQRLGKQIPRQQIQTKQWKNYWTRHFQYGLCRMKGSRLLVPPPC